LEEIMPYNTVIFERRGETGYITLNRPDVNNAFNRELIKEFQQVVCEIDRDDDIRVVIITGAGKAFQAGADISELAKMNVLEKHEWNHDLLKNWRALEALKQPVIAAINGYALGGGLELAISCDILIASENARMGLPEVSLGIIPGTGGTQKLPYIVGKLKALELILTGEVITAQEAYRIGLVNKVVPAGKALEAAEEMANRIIRNAPLAVAMAKDAVTNGMDLPIDAGVEYGHRSAIICGASEDAREGFAAFLEKRPPVWKGR
jgi:enoyl-CoA hydratase